MIDNTLF